MAEFYRKKESRKIYRRLRDMGVRHELRELSGTVPSITITSEALRLMYEPVHTPEMFSCPERMHGRHPFPREENMDYYMKMLNGDHVCSFCQSLEAGAFLRLLRKAMRPNSGVRMVRTATPGKVVIEQPGVSGSKEGATRFLLPHLKLLPEKLHSEIPAIQEQIQKAMSL